MKVSKRMVQSSFVGSSLAIFVIAGIFLVAGASAQNANFHNAPASAKELKNPYEGQPPPRQGAITICAAPAATAKMAKAQEIFLR